MIYHYPQRCIAAFLVLLLSFNTQATIREQATEQVPATQPAQNLDTLLQVLEKQQKIYGKTPHVEVARALESVGHAYMMDNNFQQGLCHYKKALKMMKVLHGKEPHVEVAKAFKNVGVAYGKLHKVLDQLSYYRKALKMYKNLHRDQAHVDVADMLSRVGTVCGNIGNTEEQLLYAKELLAICEALYGDRPNLYVAISLFNLGISYKAISDLGNALLYLQQSLEMYAALPDGGPYENVADVLNQMGIVYFSQKDFQSGLAYFERASEVYKTRRSGQVSLNEAQLMHNLGVSHIQLNNFKSALPYLTASFAIYKVLLGDQPHSRLLACLRSIGYAYEKEREFPESLSCYEKAFKMHKALYDDMLYRNSVGILEDIARVHGYMNNYEAELSHLQKAKKEYQHLCNQNDYVTNSDIARVIHNTGIAYRYLGDLRQSLEQHRHALYLYNILYKGAHLHRVTSMKRVGMAYSRLGKYQQAEKYYKKSLKMVQKLEQPHLCASIFHHLGCSYRSASYGAGKEKTRQQYRDKATEAFEAALAVNDVPAIALLTDYAHLLLNTRKYQQAYDYLVRAIATGDEQDIVEYTLAEPATVTPILQARINQEKLAEVRAIDYAFYLLLHHYEALQQAGITPIQSREACLAAYTQGINARAGQPGKEKQDMLARYLLDNLKGALSVN